MQHHYNQISQQGGKNIHFDLKLEFDRDACMETSIETAENKTGGEHS